MKRRFPTPVLVFLGPSSPDLHGFYDLPAARLAAFQLCFAPAEDGGLRFVGLGNYATLITSPQWAPRLWNALTNNLIFFVIHMIVQNPVGLLLAALLSSRIVRGKAVYRALIFTPTVLSVVLVGFIWRLILSPLWGISGDFLDALGLGSLNQPWLGQESTALVTLALVSVWQNVGIPMMLFLAALIGIPDELLEAARVDGATAWGVFWRIRFPLILPTVGIVAVLTFVGNFNAFDLIYSTQKGYRRTELFDRHHGYLFLPDLFRFSAATGQPYDGRDHRRGDAAGHSCGRAAVLFRLSAQATKYRVVSLNKPRVLT